MRVPPLHVHSDILPLSSSSSVMNVFSEEPLLIITYIALTFQHS